MAVCRQGPLGKSLHLDYTLLRPAGSGLLEGKAFRAALGFHRYLSMQLSPLRCCSGSWRRIYSIDSSASVRQLLVKTGSILVSVFVLIQSHFAYNAKQVNIRSLKLYSFIKDVFFNSI